MIALVIGTYNVEGFLWGGVRVANLVSTTLERNGVSMDSLHGILDFGCGSGRVMRRWAHLADRGLRGVDYNPYLVDWCQKTLPYARFDQNVLPEPLPLEDESVDLA